MRRRFVRERRQFSVFRRGETQMLNVLLPQSDRIKHHLPRQRELDRTLYRLRGNRG